MEKEQIITSFVNNRPESIGVYGYGSGVFKQDGYGSKDRPQIDLIFLVENLKQWHYMNVSMNKADYSLAGRTYVLFSDPMQLKGTNRITYYSQISENGFLFKYGVMEEKDFLDFLKSWENFFVAGRFQKPTLMIKGNQREEEAIRKNKEQALLVAAILSPAVVSKRKFFEIICGLSYKGTLRMSFAENPRKVQNIVKGSYEYLQRIYDFDTDFIREIDDESIAINHFSALHHVKELPIGLLTYLYENGYDVTNLHSLRLGINNYLIEHNKAVEIGQSLDGLKTNGIVRSTPYLFAKVKKKVAK